MLSQVTLVVVFVAAQVWAAFAFADLGPQRSEGRLGWDGNYYRLLAAEGYPEPLPDGGRSPDFKLYAFYPLYPMLVRAMMAVTALPIHVVAPAVSVTCATAAVSLLVVWMQRCVGLTGAAAAVLGLVMWPASPVFQMAYTEGLAMLFLVGCLWALSERRYGLFDGAVIALSLTRALAPVVAVVALVHLVQRWRGGARRENLRGPVLAAAVALGSVALWPGLAGLTASDPMIYFDAHRAFQRPDTPTSVVAGSVQYPAIGVLMVATLLLVTYIALKLLPSTVPAATRTFLIAYPFFILSTAIISTSLIRYFLFVAFPLGLVLEPLLRHRWWRYCVVVAALAISVAGTWWWVHEFVPSVVDGTVP